MATLVASLLLALASAPRVLGRDTATTLPARQTADTAALLSARQTGDTATRLSGGQSPILAVVGDTAYVANGRLHQFGLFSSGARLLHSAPVTGWAGGLATVTSADGAGTRIGVGSANTITVFTDRGSLPPTLIGAHEVATGSLQSFRGFADASPGTAVFHFVEAGLVFAYATDLTLPLTRQTRFAGWSRAPAPNRWRFHDGSWYGVATVHFLGGACSSGLVRLEQVTGATWERRQLQDCGYRMHVAGTFAYIVVHQNRVPGGPLQPQRLAIVDIASDDMPIVAELEEAIPIDADHAGLAFGTHDRELIVTVLAPTPAPRIVARAPLVGVGVAVQATESGAVVVSNRAGVLYLELFAIGADGDVSAVGAPQYVPGLPWSVVDSVFVPVVDQR